jgi:hypothetical protein
MSDTATIPINPAIAIPAIAPPEIAPPFPPPPPAPLLALALPLALFVAVPTEIVAAGVDESALSFRQSALDDPPTVRRLDVPPFRPVESAREMMRDVEALMAGVKVYESEELGGGVMEMDWPPGMRACGR